MIIAEYNTLLEDWSKIVFIKLDGFISIKNRIQRDKQGTENSQCNEA